MATQETIKQMRVSENGPLRDLEDTTARAGVSALQSALASLRSALDTLMGTDDITDEIDTYNEIKDFLDGFDVNDPTLSSQLALLNSQVNDLTTAIQNKANTSALNTAVANLQALINGKVDAVNGKGLSTNDYTNEDKAAVATIANKANSDDVYPKSQTYSKSEVDTKVAEAGSGAVSVTTNQDGTFVIHVGETDYTINLNHTHENMAKLVVCEESDLPSTLAKDTIYCQVDDADTPTEIQSLWIAGLEFVGGGGAIDDTPRLITPRDGLTLDFDGQSTLQLTVRGKNLLSDLSLTITGDFTVTDGNGTTVSTITATAANDGVVLLLTNDNNYDVGTLRIFSSEVDVTVTLEKGNQLPTGYSPLEAVSVNSMILSLANTNIPIISSWRLVLRSSSNNTQVAICQRSTNVGRYFGVAAQDKWGVAPTATIDGFSATAKTEALVEFGSSLTSLTIGDNVITATPPSDPSANCIELFGCSMGSPYYFNGYVYEIECVSGGSFHAFPAKRLSDNAVGLYDIENDVFYTGFSS